VATRFIYTGRDYVNLDTVQVAKSKDDGRHQLVGGGKMIDDNSVDFLKTIVSVVAVQGEWECLARGEGLEPAISDPVIAWGVTVLGEVIPITPAEPSGVQGEFALRKAGSPRVYASSMGGYDNETEWLTTTLPHG
jgi:hypothetical protein